MEFATHNEKPPHSHHWRCRLGCHQPRPRLGRRARRAASRHRRLFSSADNAALSRQARRRRAFAANARDVFGPRRLGVERIARKAGAIRSFPISTLWCSSYTAREVRSAAASRPRSSVHFGADAVAPGRLAASPGDRGVHRVGVALRRRRLREGRTFEKHQAWLAKLPCPVLRLDGYAAPARTGQGRCCGDHACRNKRRARAPP